MKGDLKMGYAAKLGSSSNNKINIVTIGSADSSVARTFNVASILPNDYSKLTIDNFGLTDITLIWAGGTEGSNYLINNYNFSLGTLYTNLLKGNNRVVKFTIKAFYI